MIKSCKKPPVYFESTTGSFYSQYAGLPLKSHKIALTATQSGSGTPSPSNPRHITGYSAINISHSDADTSNPTVYTIQIGSTVYGGEYDARTGVLTVTHGISTFKGLNEEGWNISGEGTSRRFRIELNGSNNTQSISDRFSWVSSNNGVWGKFRIASNSLLLLDNTSVMADVSALKTWLSNNNASFVYPLAEPFDIPLGGINLLTQEGQNNIFADCGDTTLEYLKAGR